MWQQTKSFAHFGGNFTGLSGQQLYSSFSGSKVVTKREMPLGIVDVSQLIFLLKETEKKTSLQLEFWPEPRLVLREQV